MRLRPILINLPDQKSLFNLAAVGFLTRLARQRRFLLANRGRGFFTYCKFFAFFCQLFSHYCRKCLKLSNGTKSATFAAQTKLFKN